MTDETNSLDASPQVLRGIGPSSAQKLERCGIKTIRDLLLHIPYRYQNRTQCSPLNCLLAGNEHLVNAEIIKCEYSYGRRRSLLVTLSDGYGYLLMRLFHYHASQKQSLKPGVWLQLFGEIRSGSNGFETVHPEYRLFDSHPPDPTPELRPIYRTTSGLTSARIGDWIRSAIPYAEKLPNHTFRGLSLKDALLALHQPKIESGQETYARINQALQRIVFEEILAHFLVKRTQRKLLSQQRTISLGPSKQLGKKLLNKLGFKLTQAQKRVTKDVLEDLSKSTPTMRLIQGDVGSGKTVIAAFAAIRAAENDAQTVIMAPTEILAEQHYETFCSWLSPLGINVCLVKGDLKAAARKERFDDLRSGKANVIVGTHAVFQKDAVFKHVGLTIIDEQHRFGVHQRMQLREKGKSPHQLVMTATPIPRTLTMALYADMDVSVIDQLPPGRIAIKTTIHSNTQRKALIQNIFRELKYKKTQVYWVCPAIQNGETQLRAAEDVYEELKSLDSGTSVDLLHGQMKSQEKASVMNAFKQGKTTVLVTTTVIEVGVDVPNATIIVIEDADRLGLAQLHQLRGRVGRGKEESTCVLLYQSPISDTARNRLEALRDSNDGFVIAEKDLLIRGPGDVLGTRQAGEQAFKIADLSRDRELIQPVIDMGNRLIREQPALADSIISAWKLSPEDYASI